MEYRKLAYTDLELSVITRSEERRVGKECAI